MLKSSQSNNPSNPTSIAIERALEANVNFQQKLRQNLHQLAEQKRQNRIKCLQLQVALARHWEHQDEEGAQCQLTPKQQEEQSKRKLERKKLKFPDRWSYNDERKWNRRFFSDPSKSVPEENDDTVQRRLWEGTIGTQDYCRLLPWTKKEMDLLLSCTEEVKEGESIVRDVDIDFGKVTRLIAAKTCESTVRKRKRPSSNAAAQTYEMRSVSDYRNKYIYHLSPSIDQGPFLKKEKLKILDQLEDNPYPNWNEIAKTLNTEFDTNRTPYQCYCHAHTTLINNFTSSTSNDSPWTQWEDEYLLKFLAVSGPKTVLNQHLANKLAERFFPHMSTKQILSRGSTTLLNPNYVNERWNEEEERMLVLAMKVFCDADSPINRAAALLPRRAVKSVTEKWTRSFNPEFSSQPFTKKEDLKLLATVGKRKESNSDGKVGDWKSIAAMFPTRNPRTLMTRWMELAKTEDVIEMQKELFIKKSVAKRGVVGLGDGGGDDVETTLNADDFMVRLRK